MRFIKHLAFIFVIPGMLLPCVSLGMGARSKPDGKDIIKKMYRKYHDA